MHITSIFVQLSIHISAVHFCILQNILEHIILYTAQLRKLTVCVDMSQL